MRECGWDEVLLRDEVEWTNLESQASFNPATMDYPVPTPRKQVSPRIVAPCLITVIALAALGGCFLPTPFLTEHGNVSFDVSPSGQEIVFASVDGDLHFFRLDSSQVCQFTKTSATESAPVFSPDGKSIAFASAESGQKGSRLFSATLAGGQSHQLTNEPLTHDTSPSFSPDGSLIVFARAHRYRRYSLGGWIWDDWDVYVMKSDGTEPRRVTYQKFHGARSPKFMPDGRTLLFSAEANRGGGDLANSIYKIDLAGEQLLQPLMAGKPDQKQGGAWASAPDVSVDGSVAFISDRLTPFQYDVLIMSRDGQSIHSLGVTQVSRYNQQPAFLPDGRSLLFLAGREKNAGSRPIFSLWQVDVDGNNPRCLAGSGLFTRPKSWTPVR